MSSSKGPSTLMDWRDITERLLDPQQRRAIVTKANTDDLQQLKTKNAFTKRKRRLLDQIRKNRNLAKNNNTQKSDENSTRSPNTSPRSSRCSELNFSNEDGVPSTPPPTLTPSSNGTIPIATAAAAANRSNLHRLPHQQQQLPQHPSTHPVASNASGSDNESIDMGDYENRIRPSSAFWRKKDGLSLAEKIIYYRNWKYRNFPRREDNHQTAGDMESTLTDHRLLRSNRHAAKSAATPRRRNSLDDDRQRPVTVIPKVSETVTFPPIDTRRQVAATTSPHHDEERERLPSIERNQFVSRSRSPKEDNELEEYDKKDDEKEEEEEGIAETEIDEKDKDEDKDGQPDDEGDKPDEEPENPDDIDKQDAAPVAASNPKSKKRRPKIPRVSGPRAPRPSGEPDKLIAKLNKKVERDLRTLQGQPSKGDSDDDDDDTDVDDDTMNDILHGERGKQLDSFLQAS